MKFPFLTHGQIESAAERLLSDALGDSQILSPPVDLDAIIFDYLCEHDDLIFSNEQDLGYEDAEKVLGVTYVHACRIHVDKSLVGDQNEGRYRFTVAHELGHWILHRPLFAADGTNLSLFGGGEQVHLASLNRNVFPTGRRRPPPEEWQANQFASALLINRAALCRSFNEIFASCPLVKPDGIPLREFTREIASAASPTGSLCDRFVVSREAMAIAIENCGLVSPLKPLI